MKVEDAHERVLSTERRRHATNRSFLRGQLWFRLLPEQGKVDVASGLIDHWLKGTVVTNEFREGALHGAEDWEQTKKNQWRVAPAAGYDPEHC